MNKTTAPASFSVARVSGKKKKRALALGLAAFAVFSAVNVTSVASAPAAQASFTRCSDGNWAIFDNANFGGDMFFCVTRSVNPVHPGNDRTSSASNRTNRIVDFYEHSDYRGGRITLNPGGRFSDLRNQSFNDRISSVRVN